MTSYLDILFSQLKVDEGVKLKPYVDSVGKITIGCGRNLTDNGINEEELTLMLKNDTAQAIADAKNLVPMFDYLTEGRKAVLVNMAFNLGRQRLSGFKNMLEAVGNGQYGKAADEMMDSTWAKQVGQRAARLANVMRNG